MTRVPETLATWSSVGHWKTRRRRCKDDARERNRVAQQKYRTKQRSQLKDARAEIASLKQQLVEMTCEKVRGAERRSACVHGKGPGQTLPWYGGGAFRIRHLIYILDPGAPFPCHAASNATL